MKFIPIKKIILTLLISFILPIPHLLSQNYYPIYKLENPEFSLKKRILITLKQSIKGSGNSHIWIAYSINDSLSQLSDKINLNGGSNYQQYLSLKDMLNKRFEAILGRLPGNK